MLAIHAGALLALVPGTFSWSAVLVAFVLYYLTGGLGVCLGYHRILTHRSLRCPSWLEHLFTLFGTLALQQGPVEWVATHRAHHARADREGDPHDVNRGLWWAHVAWIYRPNDALLVKTEQRRFAADVYRVAFYRFLDRTHPLWQLALAAVLFAMGGLPWVVWGIFVRLVATYHITWLVNSASHHQGYRTYATADRSTNNWWVALIAWGEGWHNNHHAFPFSARHGLRRFEFDITWYTIRVLAALRLAHDIRVPTRRMLDRNLTA